MDWQSWTKKGELDTYTHTRFDVLNVELLLPSARQGRPDPEAPPLSPGDDRHAGHQGHHHLKVRLSLRRGGVARARKFAAGGGESSFSEFRIPILEKVFCFPLRVPHIPPAALDSSTGSHRRPSPPPPPPHPQPKNLLSPCQSRLPPPPS